METAAEILGKKGLKFTYREIYDIVKDFNCGIYFSDEFLAENAGIELTKAQTKQVELTNLLNIAAVVGDEQTLKMICEELDLDYNEFKNQVEKFKEEQNLIDAKKTLNNVILTDEPVIE